MLQLAITGDVLTNLAIALAAFSAVGVSYWFSRATIRQQDQSLNLTLDHQVAVHQENRRLDAYIEFVAATSMARSTGHRWHNAIRDALVEDSTKVVVDEGGFFNRDLLRSITHESQRHPLERDAHFEALDALWNAAQKIELVGTDAVHDTVRPIVEHYDPRQRRFTIEVLEKFPDPRTEFAYDPGYPLADANPRFERFISQARRELGLLAHDLGANRS